MSERRGRGGGGRGRGFGGGRFGGGGFGGYRGGELKLPPGWEECPPFGNLIEISKDNYFKVIPSKVPLSRAYDRLLKNPAQNHYTINDAIAAVEHQFHGKVSLIIDLTKSTRYYDFDREVPPDRTMSGSGGCFHDYTIIHCKIPCQGHNQTPDAAAVNAAAFEIKRMMAFRPDDYIIVHCTHGFNRTGYVIVNAMVRIASAAGLSIARCLKRFTAARPPGIYKDAYINDLFKYHHESRTSAQWLTPAVPSWKGHGDEDDEGEPEPPPEPPKEITHERIEEIGEAIPLEEAGMLQNLVYHWLTGAELPAGRLPHFPGSQPVSLDRQNLRLLQSNRYWVSWKADGTRYLLLIMNQGCYLINREFRIARLQMRFPTTQKSSALKQYPVGPPHHETLLDGEMVVDVDPATGVRTRRYLAYDLVMLKGQSQCENPWLKRFQDLQREVIGPRDKEKRYIQRQLPEKFVAPPLAYKYETEACSVRIKAFWPLFFARKVIDKMIPGLCHEADGLILQSCTAAYVANTDNSLLKFKFAHLNSVDFYLEVEATAGASGGKGYHIYVLDTSRGRRPSGPHSGLDWNKKEVQQPVLFPQGVDGRTLHGRIVECCWVEASNSWQFMRIREDKDKPNADYVCNKVVGSIKDNIREQELLDYLDSVYYNIPHYQEDVAAMLPETKPPTLPPPPPALPTLPPAQLWTQGPASAAGRVSGEGGGAVDNPEAFHHQPLVYPAASPPYFGPEPTPPHPSGQGVLPDMWIPHDPTTYPQEYLPVYEDPGPLPLDDPALLTWGQQGALPPDEQQQGLAGQQPYLSQWEQGPDIHHEGGVDTSNAQGSGGQALPDLGSEGWGVDPHYVDEHEGNRWGKQQHGAGVGRMDLAPVAPVEASDEVQARAAAAGGNGSPGVGLGADDGVGDASIQGQGHEGGQVDADNSLQRDEALEAGPERQTEDSNGTVGRGAKRDGQAAGLKQQGPPKLKRGRKMEDDEFFDDL